jgi:hypothetical protein
MAHRHNRQAFFVRGWRQQDEKTKALVKDLVKDGRRAGHALAAADGPEKRKEPLKNSSAKIKWEPGTSCTPW